MKKLLKAIFKPLFLLVLLAAGITGLTSAQWMLPLGVGVYFVSVILTVLDDSGKKQPLLTIPLSSAPGPSAAGPISPTIQGFLQQTKQAQKELAAITRSSKGGLTKPLQSLNAQVGILANQTQLLAHKSQAVEQHLARQDFSQLPQKLAQLDQKIAAARDPYALQQLQNNRKALVETHQKCKIMESCLLRISEQIQNIAANLASLQLEAQKLTKVSLAEAEVSSQKIVDQLQALSLDLEAFRNLMEKTLKEAGLEK